tara:strand:- start:7136 stop:7318 length:183 start_codon:yes stop_codon:yes gene_type:complete
MTKLIARCRLLLGSEPVLPGESFDYSGDAEKLISRGWAEAPPKPKRTRKKAEPEDASAEE